MQLHNILILEKFSFTTTKALLQKKFNVITEWPHIFAFFAYFQSHIYKHFLNMRTYLLRGEKVMEIGQYKK